MNNPSFRQISQWIHVVDPYNNFPLSDWPMDLKGFTSNIQFMSELVEKVRPKLAIEVGSFQGTSSIIMAEVLKKMPDNPGLICVDTWLGAREFWTSEGDIGGWWNQMSLTVKNFRNEHYASLRLKNGYPQLYYQFLANVIHRQCEQFITPYPQTSVIAARWFAAHNVRADLIYIDGSHDYEDVVLDLKLYWDIVEPGGVLFGDDYWIEDVKKAVDEFVAEHKLNLQTQHPHWILHKPIDNQSY